LIIKEPLATSPNKKSAGATQMPLWKSVEADLLQRIRKDEFRDGFPGEFVLADEYAVSRATIRAALAPLRRAGLISAHRGRPSTLVNVSNEQSYGPVYSLFAAVENAGMTQRSEVETADLRTSPVVARRLGLEPGEQLVYISRIRYADNEVIATDEVWLPASRAAAVLESDLTRTALYRVLMEKCGITLSSGRETLHAITTDPEQSRQLACRRGTAAFYIQRLGLALGEPVEWRETLIRGDRFSVTTSYVPETEA
jgi:GntR family transcriptional regulator